MLSLFWLWSSVLMIHHMICHYDSSAHQHHHHSNLVMFVGFHDMQQFFELLSSFISIKNYGYSAGVHDNIGFSMAWQAGNMVSSATFVLPLPVGAWQVAHQNKCWDLISTKPHKAAVKFFPYSTFLSTRLPAARCSRYGSTCGRPHRMTGTMSAMLLSPTCTQSHS